MRKIVVSNFISVDGFFAGPNGEIDWFKNANNDEEFEAFSRESAKAGDSLIFGRTTYEMMKSYWPTPDAIKNDPSWAKVMNNIPKFVFSKTLQSVEEGPHWKNVRLFHEIDRDEILLLKEQYGKDIAILGSGSVIQQFARLGLIDEYVLSVVPVVLGAGKSMFKDVKMNLKLLESRMFKNGIVWLRYQSIN